MPILKKKVFSPGVDGMSPHHNSWNSELATYWHNGCAQRNPLRNIGFTTMPDGDIWAEERPIQKSIFFFVGGGKVNWPIFLGVSLSLFYVLFFWKRIVFLIRKLPVSQQLHLLIASVVESLLVQDFNHQKRYVSVGPLSPDMEKQWEISPKIENLKPDPNGNHSSKFQLFWFFLPKVGDKPLRRCFGDTHLWIFEIMAGLQKLGDLQKQ